MSEHMTFPFGRYGRVRADFVCFAYGGSDLFVFFAETSFNPTMWLVSGDSFSDAFDTFCVINEAELRIDDDALPDYDPESLTYNDNGVPVDTESVSGWALKWSDLFPAGTEAVFVDDPLECRVAELSELGWGLGGATELVPLTCTASFDHGLRAADETSLVIGIEASASVMLPLLGFWSSFGLGFPYPPAIDYQACLMRASGWSLDTEADYSDWLTDPDEAEAVRYWSDEMVSKAESVGWFVDVSVDAGMTWFYRPVGNPITIPTQKEG